MVQAALYQLVLDRKVGEYELPRARRTSPTATAGPTAASSKERAFPCPRTWEFASNIVKHRNGLDPEAERAPFRGTVGEAAAVEFAAFLKVCRELPHPRAIVNDPENADIPKNASALMALHGALYELASDLSFDAIVTYATRLWREVGESLVGARVRREPALQRSPASSAGRPRRPVKEAGSLAARLAACVS